jgi:hypothetical protein
MVLQANSQQVLAGGCQLFLPAPSALALKLLPLTTLLFCSAKAPLPLPRVPAPGQGLRVLQGRMVTPGGSVGACVCPVSGREVLCMMMM